MEAMGGGNEEGLLPFPTQKITVRNASPLALESAGRIIYSTAVYGGITSGSSAGRGGKGKEGRERGGEMLSYRYIMTPPELDN